MIKQWRLSLIEKLSKKDSSPILSIGTILIIAAFVWSYFPNIIDLWRMWMNSDEYSSGLLVPFISGYILYSRIKKQFWQQVLLLFSLERSLKAMFFESNHPRTFPPRLLICMSRNVENPHVANSF